METVILGWYVMVATGSVLWLTAFGSVLLLGTLVSPDVRRAGRPARRRVMLVSCARSRHVASSCARPAGSLTPGWVLVVATLAGLVLPRAGDAQHAHRETIPSQHRDEHHPGAEPVAQHAETSGDECAEEQHRAEGGEPQHRAGRHHHVPAENDRLISNAST